MRRLSILVSVAVAALMLMGVGYALLWSQTITAHVTGFYANIDVRVVACSDGVHWDAEKRKIVVQADNLYPGVTKAYSVTLQNVGSRPAALSGVTISGFHNTSDLQLSMVGPQNTFRLNYPENTFIILDDTAIRAANNGSDIVINPGPQNNYTFFFSIGIPKDCTDQTAVGSPYGFEIDTGFTIR